MPHLDRALQRGTAQIVYAMSKPGRFFGVALFFDHKGRRRRGVEQPQFRDVDFDTTGFHLVVDRVVGAVLEHTAHHQYILVAQQTRAFVRCLLDFGFEHNLHDARAVAQVDEDHATVIPAAIDPAREHDLLANGIVADLTAQMTATQRTHCIEADRFGRHRVLPGLSVMVSLMVPLMVLAQAGGGAGVALESSIKSPS